MSGIKWQMHFSASLALGAQYAFQAVNEFAPREQIQMGDIGTIEKPGWTQTALRRTVVAKFVTEKGEMNITVHLHRKSSQAPWQFFARQLQKKDTEMLDTNVIQQQAISDELKRHYLRFSNLFNRGTWENKKPTFQLLCPAFLGDTESISMSAFLATARVQMYHARLSGETQPTLLSMPVELFLRAMHVTVSGDVEVITREDINLLFSNLAEDSRYIGLNQFFKLTPEFWPDYRPLPHPQNDGRFMASREWLRQTNLINQGTPFRLILSDRFKQRYEKGLLTYTTDKFPTAVLLEKLIIEIDDFGEYIQDIYPRMSLSHFLMAMDFKLQALELSLGDVILILSLFPGYLGNDADTWGRKLEFSTAEGRSVNFMVYNTRLVHRNPNTIDRMIFDSLLNAMRSMAEARGDGLFLWPSTFEAAWENQRDRATTIAMVWYLELGEWPDFTQISRLENAILSSVYYNGRHNKAWLIERPLSWAEFKALYHQIQIFNGESYNSPSRVEAVLQFVRENIENVSDEKIDARRAYVQGHLTHWYEADL